MEKNLEKQLALIRRGTIEIIQIDDLKKKIERAISKNKPLVIKAGFDPTAPDIHLGHTVLLRKMRHFQDLGHKVVFLIGDATALVGDPTGRSQTRKMLTLDEIGNNAKTYIDQVKAILKVDDPALFQLRYNREWFIGGASGPHPFGFEQFVELAQRYTVARLLERDDFEKRMQENKPISFLELFYPLMQGYDSVRLHSDVEIGGSDQKFNMLVGRDLQQAYDQEPQIVLTMPLLEGLDGVNKMSKSLGNYVGINEPAKAMYGKIMSLADEAMFKYFELLTDEDVLKLRQDVHSGLLHPKDAKKRLARSIVAQYHGLGEASRQDEEFEYAFKEKGFPRDIAICDIPVEADSLGIVAVLSDATGLAASRGEAKRKIQEGAVEVNGARIADVNLLLSSGEEYRIRVGKKFARIVMKKK